jgi:hypothetical protein
LSSIQRSSLSSTSSGVPRTTRCAEQTAGPTARSRKPWPRVGIDAGTLLEHRLLEVTGGDSHFLAERQHLFGSQPFADVALAGLQLGGTLHDPLERGAIDLPDWRVGHGGRRDQPAGLSPFWPASTRSFAIMSASSLAGMAPSPDGSAAVT